MQLRNHIAGRFITDKTFIDETMETCLPYDWALLDMVDNDLDRLPEESQMRIASLFDVVDMKGQKAYYITDTVLDKLDMLKVSKKDGRYDFTVILRLMYWNG